PRQPGRRMEEALRRLVFMLALAVAAGAVPIVAAASAAQASAPSAGAQFLAKINGLRASKGLPSLAADAALTSFAEGWTQHMAAAGTLAHNPNLGGAPGKWSVVGE